MESSSELVAFPLLLTPIESNYRACTIPYRFPSDNPRKATPTELSWIDLFLNSIPSFRFLVFILIFFFHFFFCEFLGCWVFGINVIVSNKPFWGKMIIFCLFICLTGWVVYPFPEYAATLSSPFDTWCRSSHFWCPKNSNFNYSYCNLFLMRHGFVILLCRMIPKVPPFSLKWKEEQVPGAFLLNKLKPVICVYYMTIISQNTPM